MIYYSPYNLNLHFNYKLMTYACKKETNWHRLSSVLHHIFVLIESHLLVKKLKKNYPDGESLNYFPWREQTFFISEKYNLNYEEKKSHWHLADDFLQLLDFFVFLKLEKFLKFSLNYHRHMVLTTRF